MTHIQRLAFIGNSLPRLCGIATFTCDLHTAIRKLRPDIEASVIAMTDPGRSYSYPGTVQVEIRDDHPEDYLAAAGILNSNHVEVVSLQHEFGIFGGEAGKNILSLLSRLRMPVVTTLHTVLAQPTPSQRDVLMQIVATSARVVVMAEKGREILQSVYGVPAAKIEVIPHGVPDVPFTAPEPVKDAAGYSGRPVILTFGLLSPNKGIEVMIDAMPHILKSNADALYIVLGATHPNLVKREGEAYRDGLKQRVAALGIEGSVVFLDQFVDQETLLRYITMCDVYVTPYLNQSQMTSGTLAYSFGLGRAIVSTPYFHASELFAKGGGILVPFADPAATGKAVSELLTDDVKRHALGVEAYQHSRSMTWSWTADHYLDLFQRVFTEHWIRITPRRSTIPTLRMVRLPPDLRTDCLVTMCDDTGILQHAVHCVPDRSHGYCIDDNARGLLLAATLMEARETPLPEVMTSRFAAFVQQAWNPDTQRFRNFMSYDRRWLEETGSEDSHGRTLQSLGACIRHDTNAARRRWAADLFRTALPAVDAFESPRAFAFVLLGLDDYCAVYPGDPLSDRMRDKLMDRLILGLTSTETDDWVWFEEGLTYDNARLPQALILSGLATEHRQATQAGLMSLRWLISRQISPSGMFRPIGSKGFGAVRGTPENFDQQPLEAAATISACMAAYRAEGEAHWKVEIERAFAWFLGENDLSIQLVDIATGSCRDGLHPDRANENRGAESVLSYLMALTDYRKSLHNRDDHPRVPTRKVLELVGAPQPTALSLFIRTPGC